MLPRAAMIERIVALCTHRPWPVVMIALASALIGAYVTLTRFAINTDTTLLISENLPWRQTLKEYSEAFSRGRDLIVAVVDGDTPEIADEAADRLARALAGHPKVLRSVRRPDSGPFFDKNGLLFLSTDELTRTTEQLIERQSFLGRSRPIRVCAASWGCSNSGHWACASGQRPWRSFPRP